MTATATDSRFLTAHGRRFEWRPFNQPMGTWWHLYEIKGGVATELQHAGHGVDAEVYPDMDRSRYLWGVKFAAYRPVTATTLKPHNRLALPERRVGGHADTLEDARQAALDAFLTGRPLPVEVTR